MCSLGFSRETVQGQDLWRWGQCEELVWAQGRCPTHTRPCIHLPRQPRQPFAGHCRTGWQELLLPVRCHSCGEKNPPQPHIPIPWHRASTCPPPALLWSFQRLRRLSRQVWRRAVGLHWIVRGREGTERSRRSWGLSI